MQNKSWFLQFSFRQRIWLFATIAGMFAIVVLGLSLEALKDNSTEQINVNIDMSIKEIAPKLGVTGKALARELDLPLDVSKRTSFKSLGVSDEQLEHAVDHILSHHGTMIKYYIFMALVLGGIVFLVKLGRPELSDIQQRNVWYPRAVYILFLLVSVIVAGFLLGKSPNPMEGAVKSFKCMVGLYPDPWVRAIAFIFFIFLAIVGNKVICGWACPFGSLQELIYSIPILKNIKRRKIPFIISNSIRVLLFLVMLLFLFGVVGGKEGFVIYHNLNPFNLFDLEFESMGIVLTIIIVLMASFVTYRPFCQLICPFGFLGWIAERCSVFCVRIDKDKCTGCGACIQICPTEALKGLVNGQKIIADCFSCRRCLNKCSVDAIEYKFRWKK